MIQVMPAEQIKDGRTLIGLRVSDTGPGIASEHLSQIFDPFFTTKEVGEGSGLGLSVARRMVEEHDGWIDVVNREEGGAAFTIWLPTAESPGPELSKITAVQDTAIRAVTLLERLGRVGGPKSVPAEKE